MAPSTSQLANVGAIAEDEGRVQGIGVVVYVGEGVAVYSGEGSGTYTCKGMLLSG